MTDTSKTKSYSDKDDCNFISLNMGGDFIIAKIHRRSDIRNVQRNTRQAPSQR